MNCIGGSASAIISAMLCYRESVYSESTMLDEARLKGRAVSMKPHGFFCHGNRMASLRIANGKESEGGRKGRSDSVGTKPRVVSGKGISKRWEQAWLDHLIDRRMAQLNQATTCWLSARARKNLRGFSQLKENL